MESLMTQSALRKAVLLFLGLSFTTWNFFANGLLAWTFWAIEGVITVPFLLKTKDYDLPRACVLFYVLYLLTSASTIRIASLTGQDLRILPLGDSITWGYGSSDWNGYRQFLLTLLDGNHVEYIGSGHTGSMYNNANEGRPGIHLNQTLEFSAHTLHQQPNAILLNFGNNDVAYDDDLANAPERLEVLLKEIFKTCPDTVVVLAPLGPSRASDYQARMEALNGALPAIVDGLVKEGRHVLIAKTNIRPDTDLFDDMHLNDRGYSKLARAFYEALDAANIRGWLRDPVKVPRKKLFLSTACDTRPDWIQIPSIFPGFESPPSTASYLWGDIDGNGRADFLVLAPDGQLQPYLNLPQAVPTLGKVIDWKSDWRLQTLAIANDATAPRLLTADLTGGKTASLVYVYPNGSIYASSNAGLNSADGGAKFNPPVLIAGNDQGITDPQGVRFVDFDGDGRADLAYLTPDGVLYVWLNKANFNQQSSTKADVTALNIKWEPRGQVVGTIPGISREDIRLADINGDGLADFLLLNPDYGAVEAWLNQGPEEWYKPTVETNKHLRSNGWINMPSRKLHPAFNVHFDAHGAMDAAKGAANDLVSLWTSSFARLKSKKKTEQAANQAPILDSGAKDSPPRQIKQTLWRWEELGVIYEGEELPSGIDAAEIQFADIAGSRRASYLTVERNGVVSGFGNGCGGQGTGWGWDE